MASDLENKHFIENTVRPFFKKDLPVILTALSDLTAGQQDLRDPEAEPEDPNINAWKKQTYGG